MERLRYDLRTVQDLLGHVNVQTTMVYTHVAVHSRANITSPLQGIFPSLM